MDFEQTIYETFDRVERLDRDVRKSLKNSGSGTSTGTIASDDIDKLKNNIKGSDNVDLTMLNKSIKGQKNVDLSALNANVNAMSEGVKEQIDLDISTLNQSIKGAGDVDLTTLNQNIQGLNEVFKGAGDVDLTDLKTSIKGAGDVDLTTLNQNIDETCQKIKGENDVNLSDLNANVNAMSESFKGQNNLDISSLNESIKGSGDVDLTEISDLINTNKTEVCESIKGAGDVDLTDLETSIKGAGDVDLTTLNQNIQGLNEVFKGAGDVDLTDLKTSIKGAGDVDLTEIKDKIENLTCLIENKPVVADFETDPFILDEDFDENDFASKVEATSDFVEYTKPFIINEISMNNYDILSLFAVYCEDVCFDYKITIDVETTKACNLEIKFLDTTIGTTSNNVVTVSLNEGHNIISHTVEQVNVSNNGNIAMAFLKDDLAKVNSFRIDVYGNHIKILTKPTKFKCFSKHDETIISKVEDYNGYILRLNSETMNPGDLTQNYELIKENVRDFHYILGTFHIDTQSVYYKGFNCYNYIDLSGTIYNAMQTNDPTLSLHQGHAEIIYAIDNANYNKIFKSYHISYTGGYVSFAYIGNGADYYYITNHLGASENVAGNLCLIYDNYNPIVTEPSRIIFTRKNGTSVLYFQISSKATTLELGTGFNLTAFYDKNSRDVIRLYMKVGDKMVRKTINFSTVTDEEGNSTETAAIVEEKIIGTYDYFYETQTDKYFVVKNDKIYLFKK